MRPQNLGFEDCDLEQIYRHVHKKTQTPSANSANNSVNSDKLPLPRNLDPESVKVYSNSKNDSDISKSTSSKSTKQGTSYMKDKCKLSSKCDCSKQSSVILNGSSGKIKKNTVNRDHNTKSNQDTDSMIVKINIGKCSKENNKTSTVNKKSSCVTIYIDKSVYEDCKELLDQKLSKTQIGDNKSSFDSNNNSIKIKCSCKDLPKEHSKKNLFNDFENFIKKVFPNDICRSSTSSSKNSNLGETENIPDTLSKSKDEISLLDVCKKKINKYLKAVQEQCSRDKIKVKKSHSCVCSKYSEDLDKKCSNNSSKKKNSLEEICKRYFSNLFPIKKENTPSKDICKDNDINKDDEVCFKKVCSRNKVKDSSSYPNLCQKKSKIKYQKRKQSFEDWSKEQACNSRNDVCPKGESENLENCSKTHIKHINSDPPKNKQYFEKCNEEMTITCLKPPKEFTDDSHCTLHSNISHNYLKTLYEKWNDFKNKCSNEDFSKKSSSENLRKEILEDELKWSEYLKVIQRESDEELCKEYDEFLKMKSSSSSEFSNTDWSRKLSHDLAYINMHESESDLSKKNPERVQYLLNKLHKESAQFHLSIPGTSPLKSDNNCLSILSVPGKIHKSEVEGFTPKTIKSNMSSESGVKISFTNPNIVKRPTNSKKTKNLDFASKSLEDAIKKNDLSDIRISTTVKNDIKSKTSYPSFMAAFKGNTTVDSLSSAHSRTVAILKLALQDVADKLYTSTSEIASGAIERIHSESSKQLDIFKNYSKSDELDLRKDSFEKSLEKFIYKINEVKDTPSSSEPVYRRVHTAVSSAMSSIKETISQRLPSVNDSSSEYDVPDPNLHENKDSPAVNVSSGIDNNSSPTKAIVWFIKNKLWPLFSYGADLEDMPTYIQSPLSNRSLSDETEEIPK